MVMDGIVGHGFTRFQHLDPDHCFLPKRVHIWVMLVTELVESNVIFESKRFIYQLFFIIYQLIFLSLGALAPSSSDKPHREKTNGCGSVSTAQTVS